MRNRINQTIVLTVLVLSLLSLSSAHPDYILNSNDWKDTLSASTFFEGEKMLVRNPGEAEIAVSEADNATEVVTSISDPGVHDLASRQGLRETRFSYRDVYTNSSELEVLYVVNPHLASEALTVLPKALERDKSVTFYEPDLMNQIDDGVEIRKVGGDFETGTAKGKTKTPEEFNRRFIRENYQEGSVVLVDPANPGFRSLMSRDYVLLKGGVEEDAQLIDDLGVEVLKVVGAENTGYARRLKSSSSGDLKIAVKVGRTVTDGESAELLSTKTLETDIRTGNLALERAVYDQSDGLIELYLENRKGYERGLEVEKISLTRSSSVNSFDRSIYSSLKPGESLSLVLNVTRGLNPSGITLEGRLEGSSWSNSSEVELSEVEKLGVSVKIDDGFLETDAERIFLPGSNQVYSSGDELPDGFDLSESDVYAVKDGKIVRAERAQGSDLYILLIVTAMIFLFVGSYIVYSGLSDRLDLRDNSFLLEEDQN